MMNGCPNVVTTYDAYIHSGDSVNMMAVVYYENRTEGMQCTAFHGK